MNTIHFPHLHTAELRAMLMRVLEIIGAITVAYLFVLQISVYVRQEAAQTDESIPHSFPAENGELGFGPTYWRPEAPRGISFDF